VGGTEESKRHAGRGGEVSVAVGFARRVVLNRTRGSRSDNFAAQDGAKSRGAKVFDAMVFSRARTRSARALPRDKFAAREF
jgi:hypothetical protein